MFYANSSIKLAQVGYRGAWAEFGVEFNFPISHNWASASPVDFAYAAHDDGGASVWVSNIDRVYGMQWTVELVLKPGSTLLEQRVTLYNRSDLRHRYYWWNNAAVQVWDDSRIEYPMRFVASHGFTDMYPWPIDAQGRDLSLIKDQTNGPVSLFVHGSHEPFMGVWNPKTQTGTAHFAEYRDLPGKKIWSWGADAAGLEWRKALSDDNTAPALKCRAGSSAIRKHLPFLSLDTPSTSASTGCQYAERAEFRVQTKLAWFISTLVAPRYQSL